MKDLGQLNYFQELEVSSNLHGYFLSQAKYASDIILLVRIIDNKVASSLMEINPNFSSTDGTSLKEVTLYRQLVGSLVYFPVTRPNIAYVLHLISQFMVAPVLTIMYWYLGSYAMSRALSSKDFIFLIILHKS